jgi:hypothetical protein
MRFQHRIVGLTLLAGCGGNGNDPTAPSPTGARTWRLQKTGVLLPAVWGSSGSNVFAVGSYGTPPL